MKLHLEGAEYAFRSRGLFIFLRLMQQHSTEWVSFTQIKSAIPSISPKQLARFIDMLESNGLYLVEYNTKTTGPYRLIAEYAHFELPLGLKSVKPSPSVHLPRLLNSAKDFNFYLIDEWLLWVAEMVNAYLAFVNGELNDEEGAIFHLENALFISEKLPSWARYVTQIRMAHVNNRLGENELALRWLREANKLFKKDNSLPAARLRIAVLKAKIRYDQGLYAQAQEILMECQSDISHESPSSLNVQALLLGQRCFNDTQNATTHLSSSLHILMHAIGYVFLSIEDMSCLDALTYNVGNLVLRVVQLNQLPAEYAVFSAKWFSLNLLVNNKLGIGEDSILSELLLFDILIGYQIDCAKWPATLKLGLYKNVDLGSVLKNAEKHARKRGNKLELFETLLRKIRISKNPQSIASIYRESVSLAESLKRPDLLALLNKQIAQYN